MKKFSPNDSEIKKSLWKESLKASKSITFDQNDVLTIKFTAKQIKDALLIDKQGNIINYEFRPEFYRHLSDLRIYDVSKAKKLEVELDPKCDPKYIEAFQVSWKRYYGQRMWKQNQDIKQAKRRNIKSLIGGIITLFIFLAIQIIAVIYNNKALTIFAICTEVLVCLIWVFFSDLYQSIIYKYKPMKNQLIDFYMMYQANFITKKHNQRKTVLHNEQKITEIKIDPKELAKAIKEDVKEGLITKDKGEELEKIVENNDGKLKVKG